MQNPCEYDEGICTKIQDKSNIPYFFWAVYIYIYLYIHCFLSQAARLLYAIPNPADKVRAIRIIESVSIHHTDISIYDCKQTCIHTSKLICFYKKIYNIAFIQTLYPVTVCLLTNFSLSVYAGWHVVKQGTSFVQSVSIMTDISLLRQLKGKYLMKVLIK